MVFLNIDKRLADDGEKFFIYLFVSLPDFFFGYQNIVFVDISTIELPRIGENSLISVFSYLINDCIDTSLELAVVVRASL